MPVKSFFVAPIIQLFLILNYLAPSSLCAPPQVSNVPFKNTSAPETSMSVSKTVVTSVHEGTTLTETYSVTSFDKWKSATKAELLTTTEADAKSALIIVFPNGLAWAGIPQRGPNIRVPPPTEPPERLPTLMPEPSSSNASTNQSSKTSSTSSTSKFPTVTAHYFPAPKNWKEMYNQMLITVPDNKHNCEPADEKDPAVTKSDAESKIKAFCEDKVDKVVKLAGISEAPDMGSGITLNLTVSLNEVCSKSKEIKLSKGDCEKYLTEAVECDKDETRSHGSTVRDGCSVYMARPQGHESDLKCNEAKEESTGVEQEEALKVMEEFCKKNHDSKVSPNQGNTTPYKMAKGNSQLEISVSYDSSSCSRGHDAGYQIDEKTCNRFLSQAIKDCPVIPEKSDYGKFGGTVTDRCGVYKMEVKKVEDVICGDLDNADATMKEEDVDKAIDEYCGMDLALDPEYKSSGDFSEDAPDGLSYDDYFKGLDNYVIRMRADFFEREGLGCTNKKKFDTKGSECKRKLHAIVDKCDNKKGGNLLDATPDKTCVRWSIYGQKTMI